MSESAAEPRPSPLGVPAEVREQGMSVIIPAYEEEAIILDSIQKVRETMDALGVPYEVIVVNDGSRDRTGELAAGSGAKVVNHTVNRGYGASLKSGIRASRYAWLA